MSKTEVKTIVCADNVKIKVKERKGTYIVPKWMQRNGGMATVLSPHDHYYLDHFRRREYEDGTVEYISQPYFLNGLKYQSIKSLVDICEKEGIEFDIMPNSDHYPGKTIKFRWRQKGELSTRPHPENTQGFPE